MIYFMTISIHLDIVLMSKCQYIKWIAYQIPIGRLRVKTIDIVVFPFSIK
jgi:hypothetical protein